MLFQLFQLHTHTHTHTHKLNVDLRRRWNETSPIVFSRLAGTTTLLSGICAGWPVPAACHLSISTNDHHIRTQSSSSESGSVVESTGEHFHSFIELARATARARRKGRLEVPRQSASMIKISSVCAWTISVARLLGASLLSHS